MAQDRPGPRWRRSGLVVAGLALAAAALFVAASVRDPGLPDDRTVWFLGESPRSWRSACAPLCDAPDGSAYGYQVVDSDPRLRPATGVLAEQSPNWLQSLLASLHLRGAPYEQRHLIVLRTLTTNSGTWVECAPDISFLGPEWHPSDLTGTWIVDVTPDRLKLRVEFRPDGTIAEASAPPERRLGAWAARRENLHLDWDGIQGEGSSADGVAVLAADRSSFIGQSRRWWFEGRRE